jgi:glycosyltransferase involved in cell wall biosynthesis
MKIGFDAKRAFLNYTGLGNYSRDSIRILGEHFPSNEYHLYTTETPANERLHFLAENQAFEVHTPSKPLHKTFKGLWRSFLLLKDLKKDGIELFHGLSHELPLGIEKSDIKSVVTIHDLIFLRFPQLFKKVDRSIYLQKFKHACQVADHIIAVSEQTKRDIISFFDIPKEKITVVYQGCHQLFQEKAKPEIREGVRRKYQLPERFLLYVGTIEERKNLLSLLKAIKELPEQELVIIGNGKAYKEKCLQYIKSEELTKRVHFMPHLELAEMAAIYQEADILIYPSIFEGFGIPILEALFSRTPVITSKEGCFGEAGGPSSMYVDPLNPNEIKEAVQQILSDEDLQNKMIDEGYSYAQNFTDKKIAHNLMKVYQSL